MAVKYYGCLGKGGFNGVVKIENYSEAYVFNKGKKEFVRNDEYMKAAFNPGSEFEAITEEEANAIVEKLVAE